MILNFDIMQLKLHFWSVFVGFQDLSSEASCKKLGCICCHLTEVRKSEDKGGQRRTKEDKGGQRRTEGDLSEIMGRHDSQFTPSLNVPIYFSSLLI